MMLKGLGLEQFTLKTLNMWYCIDMEESANIQFWSMRNIFHACKIIP